MSVNRYFEKVRRWIFVGRFFQAITGKNLYSLQDKTVRFMILQKYPL